MKKSLVYSLFFAALAVCGCTGDYDDWAKPQGFDAEEPLGMSLAVTPAKAINMADVAEDVESITLFTPTATLPEGAAMTTYSVRINDVVTLAADMNGAVSKAELVETVVNLYGKRPEERKLSLAVSGIAEKGRESFILKAGAVEVGITLVAPQISKNYYIIGDPSAWDPANTTLKFSHSGKDVYEDPVFTVVFPVVDGTIWFAITDDVTVESGEWSQVFGCKEGNGANGMEGKLDRRENLPDDGSWTLTINGDAKFVKMTINMMEYSYKIEYLNFGPYYYEIGNESGWGTSHALYGANADGKYVGYYYLDGEFKFKPNADNWDGDLECVEGTATGGTLTSEGSSNCANPGAGFYQINLDAAGMTYSLMPITSISIIGTANGNWDTDTDLTYNTATGAWEYEGALNAGEIKFRVNHDWAISWGGTDFDNLTEYNGANLQLAEAGTYLVQLFVSCEGSNRCVMTKK